MSLFRSMICSIKLNILWSSLVPLFFLFFLLVATDESDPETDFDLDRDRLRNDDDDVDELLDLAIF